MTRSKLTIAAIVLVLALEGVLSTAKADETIIECRERPATREYWSWREIDGRRCWFKGHHSLPKKLLSWGPRSAAEGVELQPTSATNPPQMSRGSSSSPGEPAEVSERADTFFPPLGPFETAWRNLMADMEPQNRPKTVRPVAVGPEHLN